MEYTFALLNYWFYTAHGKIQKQYPPKCSIEPTALNYFTGDRVPYLLKKLQVGIPLFY